MIISKKTFISINNAEWKKIGSLDGTALYDEYHLPDGRKYRFCKYFGKEDCKKTVEMLVGDKWCELVCKHEGKYIVITFVE